jgi:hypothetical protein
VEAKVKCEKWVIAKHNHIHLTWLEFGGIIVSHQVLIKPKNERLRTSKPSQSITLLQAGRIIHEFFKNKINMKNIF